MLDTVAWMHNGLVQHGTGYRWMVVGREPGPEFQAKLRGRLQELSVSLSHRDATAVKRAVLALMGLTKPAASDRGDPDALASLYAAQLSDLPTWAVLEACRDAAKGRASSDIFMPAAPELYRMAEAIADPHVRERGKIHAVLTADKTASPRRARTPEEQQRAGDLADKLMADFDAKRAEVQLEEQSRKAEKPMHPWLEEFHRNNGEEGR